MLITVAIFFVNVFVLRSHQEVMLMLLANFLDVMKRPFVHQNLILLKNHFPSAEATVEEVAVLITANCER